jgi:hypothetical protein
MNTDQVLQVVLIVACLFVGLAAYWAGYWTGKADALKEARKRREGQP